MDVTSLAVGARPNAATAIDDRQVLRALAIFALRHDCQHGADVFAVERALLLEHLAKLLKDPVGLIDLLLVAVDVNDVAARHDAHAERLAQQPLVLVAAAEQRDRLVAIIERQGNRGLAVHNWQTTHSGCRNSRTRSVRSTFQTTSNRKPPA